MYVACVTFSKIFSLIFLPKRPFNKEVPDSLALVTHPIENEWWPYLWITAIMTLLSPNRVCHGGNAPQGQKPRTAHWRHHSVPMATLITIHVIQMRWAITWTFFSALTQPIPPSLSLWAFIYYRLWLMLSSFQNTSSLSVLLHLDCCHFQGGNGIENLLLFF